VWPDFPRTSGIPLAAARGRGAIGSGNDLATGAAYTESERANENRAVGGRRLGDVVEPRRVGNAGQDRDGQHRASKPHGDGNVLFVNPFDC
jgi:hypothetical protein